MIVSLILYGSRARGDHRLVSDVDLIGITDGGVASREAPARGTNLHLYPFQRMVENARNGDLFVLHIVSEGKPLHDTLGVFKQAQEAFVYRDNYSNTIEAATAVALFLLSSKTALSKAAGRRRLVWAIRTLIIAKAAEGKQPIFSANRLEEFAHVAGLKRLINKRNTLPITVFEDVGLRVLEAFGSSKIRDLWPVGKLAQREFVEAFGKIGKSTAVLSLIRFNIRRPKERPSESDPDLVYS
ncbi:MAG TPA: nucleotidyltransferase domain-containing protein [Allosphingosinicella sp.]|nr:nucleotidyltransferase domain-containing protein [Allosphingosinicella sp.]